MAALTPAAVSLAQESEAGLSLGAACAGLGLGEGDVGVGAGGAAYTTSPGTAIAAISEGTALRIPSQMPWIHMAVGATIGALTGTDRSRRRARFPFREARP
jgi:hypothetical protein